MVYTAGWYVWGEWFLAVNHHHHKNWVPSILIHNLWLILGLLGMYFDAAVVFVTKSSLLFRLAMAILCNEEKKDIQLHHLWFSVLPNWHNLISFSWSFKFEKNIKKQLTLAFLGRPDPHDHGQLDFFQPPPQLIAWIQPPLFPVSKEMKLYVSDFEKKMSENLKSSYFSCHQFLQKTN